MFSEVLQDNISLSKTKHYYLLIDALGPYFPKEMLNEAASAFQSVIHVKMINNASNKKLLVCINYWSDQKKQLVSHPLQFFFFFFEPCNCSISERKKKNILKSILDANLPVKNSISVAIDDLFMSQNVL